MLRLKAETALSRDGKTLSFTETTGVYNVSTNPEGYNSPNEPLSNMTAAMLEITTPTQLTYTIDLFTQGFPTGTTATFDITKDMIGGNADEVLDDGLYVLIYTVTGDAEYTFVINDVLYHNIKCCVYKHIADIDISDCSCDNPDTEYAAQLYVLFQTLVANAENGYVDRITELINALTKMCAYKPCNC